MYNTPEEVPSLEEELDMYSDSELELMLQSAGWYSQAELDMATVILVRRNKLV